MAGTIGKLFVVGSGIFKSPATSTFMRGVAFSGLVLSVLPNKVSCEEDKDKPNFEKKTASKNPTEDRIPFDFDGLGKLIAGQMGNNGSFSGVKELFESGIPGQFGYGFLMGYSSGFCIKKVSKVFAFLLGGSFILVQSLSYSGLIKVNYEGMQKQVEKVLDLNNDGKVDVDDLKYAQKKVLDVLGYNMPAGGGFAAGLIAGLKA